MLTILQVVIGLTIGYVVTVYSDWIIHRMIWHGRWKMVHRGPLRWLLYPHFAQHIAHHQHSKQHRPLFEAGKNPPEEALHRVETKHQKDSSAVHRALACSTQGITVSGPWCISSYLSLFMFTPLPYVAVLLGVTAGPVAGISAGLVPLFAVACQVLHKYYHMAHHVRVKTAPRYLVWLLQTQEFGNMSAQHNLHHYDRVDDNYSVLPFGRRIIRPVLGIN